MARAIFFPAFIAHKVGFSPIIPDTEFNTISAQLIVATSHKPSIPHSTFTSKSAIFFFKISADFSSKTATFSGLNSLICSSSSTILLKTARPFIETPKFFAIFKAFAPTEPVEPSTEIFFVIITSAILNSHDVKTIHHKIHKRNYKNNTVKTIQKTAVTRNYATEVLYVTSTFYRRKYQISNNRYNRTN